MYRVCKASALRLSYLLAQNLPRHACSFLSLELAVTAIFLIDQESVVNLCYFCLSFYRIVYCREIQAWGDNEGCEAWKD